MFDNLIVTYWLISSNLSTFSSANKKDVIEISVYFIYKAKSCAKHAIQYASKAFTHFRVSVCL
jgi:hypothetical protein